ncbi:MAG: fatty acid desaturase [Bdellovibrionales bacterium]|nr:fatty acid desaturase [Bdellovibrionales bacterium]
MSARRSLFQHSPRDAALVAVTLAQVGLWVLTLALWSVLPLPMIVSLGLVQALLICTNFQCVAHNFIHHPFFASAPLNGAFSILNSLALAIPQSLYRVHHLNHHEFSNAPGDWSALSRHAAEGEREEPLSHYAVLGPLRSDLGLAIRAASSQGLGQLVAAELGFMALFAAVGIWVSAPWFFLFFVPTVYLGQALAHAENYLEHHRADPGNRLANSVSCYSPAYNALWFNNGYHQEHHSFPRVHWTKLPELRSRMLPEARRRVVKGAHALSYRPLR